MFDWLFGSSEKDRERAKKIWQDQKNLTKQKEIDRMKDQYEDFEVKLNDGLPPFRFSLQSFYRNDKLYAYWKAYRVVDGHLEAHHIGKSLENAEEILREKLLDFAVQS